MALLAEHVVETDWTRLKLRVLDAELRQAFLDEAAQLARLADARHITFHVGHEARDAYLAKTLRQHLKGDGLSCSGGACHQSVPVGHLADDAQRPVLAMSDV